MGQRSHRHVALMAELGGRARLASLLGVSEEAVRKWERRGIPPAYWHRVAPLKAGLTPEWLAKTKSGGRR